MCDIVFLEHGIRFKNMFPKFLNLCNNIPHEKGEFPFKAITNRISENILICIPEAFINLVDISVKK